MNNELSKCCNSEVKVVNGEEGTSWYMCVDCGESCDISPHQEPVATQQFKNSEKRTDEGSISSPQEPMEWEEYSFKGDKPEKCDMICDHCVCWCGDSYACCNCGLRFIPAKWANSQIKQADMRVGIKWNNKFQEEKDKIIKQAEERGYKNGRESVFSKNICTLRE